MTDQLAIATAYVAAANAKDIDGCVDLLTEDAIMDSPMGPKKGKAAIRTMLGFLLKMSGTKMPEPEVQDGTPTTSFRTPGGPAKMTFIFEGDKISHIRVAIG